METTIHRVEKVTAGEIQRIAKSKSGAAVSYREITVRTSTGEELALVLMAAESDSLIIKGE